MMNMSAIFKNDLLVKQNQFLRLGRERLGFFSSCILHTRSTKLSVNLFAYTALLTQTIASTLLLILIKKKSPKSNSVFIYTDKRHLKFSRNKFEPACIGLRKLLLFRRDHIYRHLSKSEIINCMKNAILLQRAYAQSIGSTGTELGLSIKEAQSLSGFDWLACIDLLLAKSAIAKFKKIESAGHFDRYTALASEMRKDGEIDYFSGAQHGLFETFSAGAPQPHYYDEYCLLFPESAQYFSSNLSANSACKVHFDKHRASFTNCMLSRPTIGVALQTDDYISDTRLLGRIQKIAVKCNYDVIAYAHPTSSSRSLKKLKSSFPKIRIEPKTRCSNIDLIITRYSTLAMDYVARDIPAIFWMAPDKVCVSTSENPKISSIESLDELPSLVDRIMKGKRYKNEVNISI